MSFPIASYLRDHPLAVTGLGLCGSTGLTTSECWSALLRGEVSAADLEINAGRQRLRLPVYAAGGLRNVILEFPRLRRLDRSVQLAQIAAQQAWADAGGAEAGWNPERACVIAGSSRGPVSSLTTAVESLPYERCRPTTAPGSAIASLSGWLAASFGIRGAALTVSATCSSGGAAIALAAQQLLLGTADVALVGAAEAPLTDLVLAQLHSARILAHGTPPTLACRPFDAARHGTVLGEGAGFLILEPLENARRRKAPIHALLTGWALGSESASRTGMDPEGVPLARVMREALDVAALSPASIDYLNLHGTGTWLNDLAEAQALRRVFAGALERLACSSTKAMTGHCLGAASAIEAVISILALRHGILPPTINCSNPDVAAPPNLLRETPHARPVKTVMTNSSGFWGTHTSLIFSQPP